MGDVVRSMDWSRTPLGPIGSWPQTLRTTVSLCLASSFPISLVWGPQHIQVYNDGYWPICGAKHPGSMGQDFTECWASAWPVIGDAFERALSGTTAYLENQRIFLDRYGFLEETCFTFSFSPIRDESGGVGGLFHPVTEVTGKMLGERRTRGLRDLAARAGRAQSTQEALALAARACEESNLDLPFVLFYAIEAGKEARLVAQAGLAPGMPASPVRVDLGATTGRDWPLREVAASNRAERVDDLEGRFGPFICGPYPESPRSACVLPITLPGHSRAEVVMVAGVSARLALTEEYRAHFDLVAAGVAAAVANARAYEEERRRAEALAEIDRAKTAFFSNVSHEFRTPLTLMMAPLEDELAEGADPLPPARRERLLTAYRNSTRLLRLVNSLLDFSRVEAGRADACFEATDLARLTADVTSTFRSAVEKAGLTLTVDCPPLPEPVHIDREMWEKVVLNLLSNAFKHTFEGGIEVRLRSNGDRVELAVADSGVGIPAGELPRMFERFHRVKGTRSRTHEGTGIGLALVRELVSLHGGELRIESVEGKGSTFAVTVKAGTGHLPARAASAAATRPVAAGHAARAFVDEALRWLPDAAIDQARVAAEERPFVAAAPGPPPEGRPRVLWCDDNADMRDYVQRLLAGRYEVTAVADGLAALESARREPPDLVLTDIMMPRLDGFGLLRELRADPRTRTVPVILLSARAGEESAVEGLDAGADDYLIKPFSAKELLARVRTHVAMARMRSEWARELGEANAHLDEALRAAKAAHETAVAQLSEEQAKLRQIAHNMQEVFYMVSPDGGEFLYVSPAYETVWGRPRETLFTSPRSWVEALHPDDRDRVPCTIAAQRGLGEPYGLVYRIVRPGGAVRWIDGRGVPVRDEAGRVTTYVGTARDITDQKEAEEELRLLHSLTTQVNDARSPTVAFKAVLDTVCAETAWVLGQVWVPSRDGTALECLDVAAGNLERFEVFREASRKMRFVPGQGLPGRIWASKRSARIADLRSDPGFLRAREASLVGLRSAVAVPVLAGDDVVAVLEFLTREPRAEEDSRLLRLVSSVAAQLGSVMRRKLAEESLARTEEQLRRSQKMEAIGRLAGGVAHDFNNLLTGMIGYSDLVLAQLGPGAPSRRLVEEIRKAGDRASGLTRQLLVFSRKEPVVSQILDPNPVVTDMEAMVRRLIGEDIDLRLSLGSVGCIKVDKGYLEQVILNLCVNARDAMPRGGNLTIETTNVDLEGVPGPAVAAKPGPRPHIQLTVSDTGSGMGPEVLARIFEPFFTTKEAGKGTGLGLSTVYGIVEGASGHITVYSEVGRGSSFKVYFPCVDCVVAAPAGALASVPLGTETILVVEDDDMVRNLVHSVLEMNGYEVLVAPNPAEAIRASQQRADPIHLVVTDVVMPGQSGPELVAKLERVRPGLRVLFMSGYTSGALQHQALAEGRAFLQKPFAPDGLARKVREVLDAKR
jgi:PAS domain S-box-containing protein